jgi:hypothetical protein
MDTKPSIFADVFLVLAIMKLAWSVMEVAGEGALALSATLLVGSLLVTSLGLRSPWVHGWVRRLVSIAGLLLLWTNIYYIEGLVKASLFAFLTLGLLFSYVLERRILQIHAMMTRDRSDSDQAAQVQSPGRSFPIPQLDAAVVVNVGRFQNGLKMRFLLSGIQSLAGLQKRHDLLWQSLRQSRSVQFGINPVCYVDSLGLKPGVSDAFRTVGLLELSLVRDAAPFRDFKVSKKDVRLNCKSEDLRVTSQTEDDSQSSHWPVALEHI